MKFNENSKLINTRWTFFRVKLVFEYDFETSWSWRPLDLLTLGLPPNSFYFLLLLPTYFYLLFPPGLVWGGGRGVKWLWSFLSFYIGDWAWTFHNDVKKLLGGWWWVYLDYNVSSGPFLSFEIEIGDGPGPELDKNIWYLNNLYCKENMCKYYCLRLILPLISPFSLSFLSCIT